MPPCSSRLAVALAAFLMLPAQYLLPSLYSKIGNSFTNKDQNFLSEVSSCTLTEENLLPVDIFISVALVLFGLVVYMCEWVQRKIMEKRMTKLSEYLCASIARLDAWSAQQRQLELRLAMIQSATTEYNLLLFLLVRNKYHECEPSEHFFGGQFDYDSI